MNVAVTHRQEPVFSFIFRNSSSGGQCSLSCWSWASRADCLDPLFFLPLQKCSMLSERHSFLAVELLCTDISRMFMLFLNYRFWYCRKFMKENWILILIIEFGFQVWHISYNKIFEDGASATYQLVINFLPRIKIKNFECISDTS